MGRCDGSCTTPRKVPNTVANRVSENRNSSPKKSQLRRNINSSLHQMAEMPATAIEARKKLHNSETFEVRPKGWQSEAGEKEALTIVQNPLDLIAAAQP